MPFTSVATARRRDLALVVSAKSVSLLGDEVAAVALVLHLQSHGAGAGAVAALLVAALIPLVVLAPLVGRLVDGHDSRVLLVASSLVQAALCALLAFQSTTPAILGLVALLGAGQAVNGATWQALLPAIAGKDGLPKALGLSQAAATVASILAPALAGVLTGEYGTRLPLLLDAATFLAITGAALLVSTRRGTAGPTIGAGASTSTATEGGAPTIGPDASTSTALLIIRADPLLRMLLVLLGVFVTLGSMVNVVEVFLIRGTLHASTTWYGISGAALAVGMLGGALAGGRLRGERAQARALVVAAVALAGTLAAIAAVPSVYWLLPVAAALGATNGVLNVALGALVMGRAPASARGRVAAAVSAVASAAQIGAYVVGGLLATTLTPRTIFVLAGVLGLLAPALLGRAVVRAASAGATDTADCEVTVVEGAVA